MTVAIAGNTSTLGDVEMTFCMTADECTRVLSGKLVSGDGFSTGVSIDSRSLRPGDLFFAIRGERFDGQDYIDQAISAGASGVVVSREIPSREGAFVIRVSDTTDGLLMLAAHHRRQWGGKLACITGSVGKTTTKEMLANLLQTKYDVHRSPGNFNNVFGLSLALLGLQQDHGFGVVEVGMNAPREIARLACAAAPDLGLLTRVAPVHLEFFPSLEDIALAKAELLEGMNPEGVLVYNADDDRVTSIARRFPGRRVSFGVTQPADFHATSVSTRGLLGSRFEIQVQGERLPASLPLWGTHNISNFLGATAAANTWGVAMERIVAAGRDLKPPDHRGVILRFPPGFTLIDDSYNSNPAAMCQMVEQLSATPGFARKIVVAGEMLELGKESPRFHEECGRITAKRGVHMLIGVRGDAHWICRGAESAGMCRESIRFFEEVDQAYEFLSHHLSEGDLILVKGSHGVHLEKLVVRLSDAFRGQAIAEDRK